MTLQYIVKTFLVEKSRISRVGFNLVIKNILFFFTLNLLIYILELIKKLSTVTLYKFKGCLMNAIDKSYISLFF